MPIFFFTVEQQQRAIVERFGKFVRVAGPGLQTKTPFVTRVAGRMSLQVEQLNAEIETKTKDNVFVHVKLAVQYKVGASDQQVQDAYYKLEDPEVQIQAYAFDVVRSHIPTMNLDEAYADADTIAMHIQDTLHRQMADYGYEIVKALITNIEPDQRVKDAMNNINASQRNQIAAAAQGDAQKTSPSRSLLSTDSICARRWPWSRSPSTRIWSARSARTPRRTRSCCRIHRAPSAT